MKSFPIVIWFLILLVLLGIGLAWLLLAQAKACTWAEAAQVVAMVATLVMLAVVWVQLAVQTVGAILSSAQDEDIRQARGLLFAAEDKHGISKLRCTDDPNTDEWQTDWKQAADRVSQNWNSVAFLLRIDPVARFLISSYIKGTRRTILKSHFIAQPRIRQRRDTSPGGQSDLWQDFDWLAKKAATHLGASEAEAWHLH